MLKYWKVDPVRGEIVVSMRFPPGLELPTHYHTGIVDRLTRFAGPGATSSTTGSRARATRCTRRPASSHTPQSVGDEDAEVFFYLIGELEFLDESGNLLARENAKTALARYEAYCDANGLKAQDLTSFTN